MFVFGNIDSYINHKTLLKDRFDTVLEPPVSYPWRWNPWQGREGDCRLIAYH